MKEFRVEWRKLPFSNHSKRVMFVLAATANDAQALAIDHIERKQGLARSAFSICDINEVTKPLPPGRIKE